MKRVLNRLRLFLCVGLVGLLFGALLLPVKAAAHPAGWSPFLKINGEFTQQYPILSNKYGDGVSDNLLPIPQSQTTQTYVVGQSIEIAVDFRYVNFSPDLGPVTYTIDLGDGNKVTDSHVNHVYDKAGSYIASVTAAAPAKDFNQEIEAVVINVVPYAGYQMPQAVPNIDGHDYKADDSAYYTANQAVRFDGRHSHAGSSPIVSYTWDFGDKQKSDTAETSHRYDPSYQFSLAILRVTDQNGLFSDSHVFVENKDFKTGAALTTNPPAQHTKPNTVQKLKLLYMHATNALRSTLARFGGNGNPVPWYGILGVLVLAFFLGALHALTPGHSKSFMTALLVGKKRARAEDVFVLSSAITLTHTAVIYILGFILLVLDTQISLNTLLPAFERVSALLVIALGGSVIYKGFAAVRTEQHHAHAHASGHEHSHDHNFKPADTSRRSLFMAGVSGGFVPCIDALSLLIVAAGVHAVGLGLLIVACFSLGLASAIVILGLVVIRSKRLLKLEEKTSQRVARYAPFVTGGFIILLGMGLLLGHQI